MKVECLYASEKEQYLIALSLQEGITIEEVIRASGVLENFPELELSSLNVGIFGQKKLLTDPVYEGDRVEIYRPLLLDPMEARRRRAPAPKRRKY
ncbi:MAG: RnfH family protein [Pseudomonadota bacterium]